MIVRAEPNRCADFVQVLEAEASVLSADYEDARRRYLEGAGDRRFLRGPSRIGSPAEAKMLAAERAAELAWKRAARASTALCRRIVDPAVFAAALLDPRPRIVYLSPTGEELRITIDVGEIAPPTCSFQNADGTIVTIVRTISQAEAVRIAHDSFAGKYRP